MRYILPNQWRRALLVLSTKLSHAATENLWALPKSGSIIQTSLTPIIVRRLLTTSVKSSDHEISDNIIRSPFPAIEIPTDVPFHEYIFQKCDLYKNLPALMEYQTRKTYTYSKLKENAIKVASGIHRLGFKKGDVLLCFSTNHIDICVLMLACSCLGIWYTAANPTFRAEELSHHVTDCGCVAIFTIASLTETVRDALNKDSSHKVKRMFVFGEQPGFQPFQSLLDDDGKAFPDVDINPQEDVFALPYSSGTTGLPKGVMLTHFNVFANCLHTRKRLNVTIGERVLCLLPLYHIYGMAAVQYGVLECGGLLVTLPKFEPEVFLRCIQDTKIELLPLVPSLITFLAKDPLVSKYDITSVRRIYCGATALGEALTKEFLQRHSHRVNIAIGYGLTETITTNMDTEFKHESIGALVANTVGKIVDPETNKTLGPYELGEYCVKGPQVMKGYLNNQGATESIITSYGWLHTGDLGYFDEDQTVYIKDRLKELIKYKGSQVSPNELESLLLGHGEVVDVAVVGVPDESAGELPKAFVVKVTGSVVSEEDLVKFVEGNTSPVKWLRGGVQFIEVIPRSLSGKILRRLIKEQYITKTCA